MGSSLHVANHLAEAAKAKLGALRTMCLRDRTVAVRGRTWPLGASKEAATADMTGADAPGACPQPAIPNASGPYVSASSCVR